MRDKIFNELLPEDREPEYRPEDVAAAFDALEERVVRDLILEGKRIDGRTVKQVRPIYCEVGVLPRTHGSAIFQRGETQSLVTTTLGTTSDEQRVDGLGEEYSKKFMLDYNFPPFSVGECQSDSRSGPARDRPRRPGRAQPQGRDSQPGQVPLHDPRGLRHPGVQRLQQHGQRSVAAPCP